MQAELLVLLRSKTCATSQIWCDGSDPGGRLGFAIEDYAVIGDTETAALVGRDGSIDWLCVPRFDSGAIFAALLGTEEHGRWLIAPASPIRATRRRYRGDTMVLETEFDTDEGTVRLIDFMPIRGKPWTSSASSKVSAGACPCAWTSGWVRLRPRRAVGTPG